MPQFPNCEMSSCCDFFSRLVKKQAARLGQSHFDKKPTRDRLALDLNCSGYLGFFQNLARTGHGPNSGRTFARSISTFNSMYVPLGYYGTEYFLVVKHLLILLKLAD